MPDGGWIAASEQLRRSRERVDDELVRELCVESRVPAGGRQRFRDERDVGRRARHHRPSGLDLVLRDGHHRAEHPEQVEQRVELVPPLLSGRDEADHPAAHLDRHVRHRHHGRHPGERLLEPRDRHAGEDRDQRWSLPVQLTGHGVQRGRLHGKHDDVRARRELGEVSRPLLRRPPAQAAPHDPTRSRQTASPRAGDPLHAQPRAIAAAMLPAPAKPIRIRRRLCQPRAHARRPSGLVEEPFSTSRACCSADTSTLRGVSRKVFSAIFCIPPSSA